MNDHPLQHALGAAMRLLRRSGLRGAFGGGLAVIVWGRPRVTQDLDLFIDLEPGAVDGFLRCAIEEGFSYDSAEAAMLMDGGFIRLLQPAASEASMPLDVLVADTALQ